MEYPDRYEQGQAAINPQLNLSGYGEDGYFKGTKSYITSMFTNAVFGTFKQLNCRMLSRNANKAESELENLQLGKCLWIACGWQIVLLFVFSILFFKTDVHNGGVNYSFLGTMLLDVGSSFVETFYSSLTSVYGIILLMILAGFKMLLVSTCLTTSGGKHAESIKELIIRYTSLRSFPKPFLFGTVACAQCLIFIQLFDKDYEKLFVMKKTSEGLTNFYFLESAFLIRLAAFVTGMEFFLTNFAHGGFRLQFPSSRVRKCPLDYLIDIVQPFRTILESFYIASLMWLTCLLIGPMLYSPFISAFGMSERVFMFLDIRFISRIFLWIFLPRLTFQLYVNVLSAYFVEIVNFPVECSTTTVKYLTLSEAMKGDSVFVKYLSFYELNVKAQLRNSDVMIFFALTHPGNHPRNWNGVFAASCDALTAFNTNVISFLRSVELSPSLLQFRGFQTDILSVITPAPLSPSRNTEISASAESPSKSRPVNIRDLGSTRGIPETEPTVYDLVMKMPTALLNDLKDACKGLITWVYIDLSNLLYFKKLETKIREKQIANSLEHATLSLWAMTGTLELMCISMTHDPSGIFLKDLQCFIKKIVETYDLMTLLDHYMCNTFEKVDVNWKILEESTDIVRKIVGASVFVLAKLHFTFSHYNKVLSLDKQLQTRIEDIIS